MTYAVGKRGAVDRRCPRTDRWGRCQCGTCAVCGYAVHFAVHMHTLGESIDGTPFDHAFTPRAAAKGEG